MPINFLDYLLGGAVGGAEGYQSGQEKAKAEARQRLLDAQKQKMDELLAEKYRADIAGDKQRLGLEAAQRGFTEYVPPPSTLGAELAAKFSAKPTTPTLGIGPAPVAKRPAFEAPVSKALTMPQASDTTGVMQIGDRFMRAPETAQQIKEREQARTDQLYDTVGKELGKLYNVSPTALTAALKAGQSVKDLGLQTEAERKLTAARSASEGAQAGYYGAQTIKAKAEADALQYKGKMTDRDVDQAVAAFAKTRNNLTGELPTDAEVSKYTLSLKRLQQTPSFPSFEEWSKGQSTRK